MDQPPAQTTQKKNPAPLAEQLVVSAKSATDMLHLEKWLSALGERHATDLHLSVGNVPMLRVDGAVMPIEGESIITAERLEQITEALLSAEELERLNSHKQIVLGKTLKKFMRFRLHIFYTRGYPALSFRHLPSETVRLAELGMPEIVSEFITAEEGLYIIGGPFDAGKSTTLKSMLSEINHLQSKYIVTLENPIEYIIPGSKSVVIQREIGRDVESFASALAALHDEDVDVVGVSDIDTPEAFKEMLELAASGRLVIAIVSGSSSVAILEALRDMFPASDRSRVMHMIADVLLGITVQQLLPKVGGGRTVVAEVVRANRAITSLIRDEKLSHIPQIIMTSKTEGMRTMEQSLAEAVRAGLVSVGNAKERSGDANQFNMMISH